MSAKKPSEKIIGNFRLGSLIKPSWIADDLSTLGKTIGEGTFGKVKLGYHTVTEEKVAVKILEKKRITDKADMERLTREINILKILRHPNIIQLYQVPQPSH